MLLSSSRRVRSAAFTLVELLVVIGIIAILISILLPTLSKVRASAMKTRCLANLRSIGQMAQVYAYHNNGMLPAPLDANTTATGTWLWDMPIITRDAMVASGAQRKIFYCPSFSEQDHDTLWNYNSSYSVLGYFILFERGGKKPNGYPTLFERVYQTTLNFPDPVPNVSPVSATDTELATDGVISQNGQFGAVKGGSWQPHSTSHMNSKGLPEGGNILFMDGHCSWRPFEQMVNRNPTGNPCFWF